jgi:hypothetical protein
MYGHHSIGRHCSLLEDWLSPLRSALAFAEPPSATEHLCQPRLAPFTQYSRLWNRSGCPRHDLGQQCSPLVPVGPVLLFLRVPYFILDSDDSRGCCTCTARTTVFGRMTARIPAYRIGVFKLSLLGGTYGCKPFR